MKIPWLVTKVSLRRRRRGRRRTYGTIRLSRCAAGKKSASTENKISLQGIIFIAAGFETTSNTLSTLCYNLARYPNVLNTLLEEVDEITDKFDGVVDHETIADMEYLEAVVMENLRMHTPVLAHIRTCKEDCEVCAAEAG